MAEVIAHYMGEGAIEASSAGLFPAEIVQPETIQVLAEKGYKLEPREPRSIMLVDPADIDLLINMSPSPISKIVTGFTCEEIPWQVRDPIGQSLDVYRNARDQIEKRVRDLLKDLRKR